MSANILQTIGCDHETKQSRNRGELESESRLPKLLWAGTLLFSANLAIATGVMDTPLMNIDLFGREVRTVRAASMKPSPFTGMIILPRAGGRRPQGDAFTVTAGDELGRK